MASLCCCCCFTSPDECVCNVSRFAICHVNEHLCGCRTIGPAACRTTLVHSCVCTSTTNAHLCRANDHFCVCPLEEAAVYPRTENVYKWNINCRAKKHRCACYCGDARMLCAKEACRTMYPHRCICEAGATCFAEQHECVCVAIGASKCKASGFHPCLCVTRGPTNCIHDSRIWSQCPCTCTTAGDNSACRTVGAHKCACRCIMSGTMLPSVDPSVCRVPKEGVHTYYEVAFCPPYTK